MRQLTRQAGSFLATGEGVTLGGSVLNLGLALLKLAAGVLGHSAALVADAFHSLSDLASDIVVLLGYRVGRMPEDEHHPYGHGKVETLCTAVVSGILIAAGLGLAGGAVASLLEGEPAGPPARLALWAALASIILKEFLYQWTARVALRSESRLILANAWHHRSDAFSSVAALVGVAGARWGAHWMDPAAALAVSLFVVKVGWDLGFRAVRDLVDTVADPDITSRIAAVVASVEGVQGFHDLRTRNLGKDVLVDVDVEVEPDLNVIQGHDVARSVRAALLGGIRNVRDAMVHVEPTGAKQGIYAPSRRADVVEACETAARNTAGVLGVHGTRVVPMETGYLLNLDVEVAPDLPVGDAHRIAHQIKEAVRRVPGVCDAVIHVDVHGG